MLAYIYDNWARELSLGNHILTLENLKFRRNRIFPASPWLFFLFLFLSFLFFSCSLWSLFSDHQGGAAKAFKKKLKRLLDLSRKALRVMVISLHTWSNRILPFACLLGPITLLYLANSFPPHLNPPPRCLCGWSTWSTFWLSQQFDFWPIFAY